MAMGPPSPGGADAPPRAEAGPLRYLGRLMSDEQHIIEPTGRTRIRRHPERAAYERELIHSILDEALICHVAYVAGGEPRVIPTVHARIGDVLYVHGSRASRTIHSLTSGIEVCVTATIVDALVLARSAFAHSMNYRSVIVYGHAHPRLPRRLRSAPRSRVGSPPRPERFPTSESGRADPVRPPKLGRAASLARVR